jgi:hypothetical protein
MSQYVTYDYTPTGLGALPTAYKKGESVLAKEQIDKMTAEEAMSDATQRSTNIALCLKALLAKLRTVTPTTAQQKAKLQTIANDADGLRKRMNIYFQSLPKQNVLFKMTAGEWAMALTALPPLVIIKQIWGEDPINKNGHLMLRQQILFQAELQKLVNRYYAETGVEVGGCKMFPPPKPRPKEPKVEERFLDFLWGTVKVGAVVLGGWLLYKHLEKQTRYPADRLPRYAGGRRKKTTRRKRRRRKRR